MRMNEINLYLGGYTVKVFFGDLITCEFYNFLPFSYAFCHKKLEYMDIF
jgi:hypothetical protein